MKTLFKTVCLTTALAATLFTATASAQEIVRTGESRVLFNNIYIPAGAETLYLSGAGASAAADGSWGNMEQQTVNIFEKFKATLEEQGWSMSDIVQVRIFGVAGPDGEFDFDGINSGYLQFFGTEANPTKPVRTTVVAAEAIVFMGGAGKNKGIR